jgi:hypothetical protein
VYFLKEIDKLFSRVAVPFYFPISNTREIQDIDAIFPTFSTAFGIAIIFIIYITLAVLMNVW